jgi:hypothetical protein
VGVLLVVSVLCLPLLAGAEEHSAFGFVGSAFGELAQRDLVGVNDLHVALVLFDGLDVGGEFGTPEAVALDVALAFEIGAEAFFGERLVLALGEILKAEAVLPFGEAPGALGLAVGTVIPGLGRERLAFFIADDFVYGFDSGGILLDGLGLGGGGVRAGQRDQGNAGDLAQLGGHGEAEGLMDDRAGDLSEQGGDGGAVVEQGDFDGEIGGTAATAAVFGVLEAELVLGEGAAVAAHSVGVDVAALLSFGVSHGGFLFGHGMKFRS